MIWQLANNSTTTTDGTTDEPTQTKQGLSWINRSSTIPLYHQLFLTLRDRLLSGEWGAGELFLRDLDIEQTYDVSRITVRRAMEGLVNEGLVVRYRGKGTFAAHIPTIERNTANDKKPAEFAAIPGPYRQEVTETSKILISQLTAQRLGVPDNHLVSMLRMTHWIADVPICTEAIFVDDFKWPGIFDRQVAERADVSEIYRRNGMVIAKISQSVSAIIPVADTAKLLGLAPNQPALFINRVSYTKNGIPIDFRLIYCRGDRFVLTQDIMAEDV